MLAKLSVWSSNPDDDWLNSSSGVDWFELERWSEVPIGPYSEGEILVVETIIYRVDSATSMSWTAQKLVEAIGDKYPSLVARPSQPGQYRWSFAATYPSQFELSNS